MKRRRRRAPATVLDRLVDDGVVGGKVAAKLRAMWKRKAGDDKPLTDAEQIYLATLHHAVMQPARADGRLAVERAKAMAIERAYYKARGLPDPTMQAARKWAVSSRSIRLASRAFPFSIASIAKHSMDARKIIEDERKRLKKAARRVGRK